MGAKADRTEAVYTLVQIYVAHEQMGQIYTRLHRIAKFSDRHPSTR